MKVNIRTLKTGDTIKILPRTRIKTVKANSVVLQIDAICNKNLPVKKVNKKSIAVEFMGKNYRLEFKSNPSVEKVE